MVCVLTVTGAYAQSAPAPEPDPQVAAAVEAALAVGPDPRSEALKLWRACAARHGDIQPALDELSRREEQAADRPAKLPIIRMQARLYRMVGDTRRAREQIFKIQPKERNAADILAKAELLDAQGSTAKAIEFYDRLLQLEISDALRNRVLLRKALMQEKNGDGPSPLAAFASDPNLAPQLRNQAAVILALNNEQEAAIKIFEVQDGPGSHRFRQEIRLAEWSIEAGLWDEAQRFTWMALDSAKLKRDRRYALTILVEAYRRDDALEELTERLAGTERLSPEAQQTWIDLLRETGKVDEAIRLFNSSPEGLFSNDMRRQMLEMCREGGKEQLLEESYARLIGEQPRFIEWREGLARHHLERGNREAAIATWSDYLQQAASVPYRMAAAQSLMKLGLDDLATRFARACMEGEETPRNNALLFLFEMGLDRGRMDDARAALEELDRSASPSHPSRMDMSDAWARLGDKKKAAAALAGLIAARDTANPGPDAEMKLAFLYSVIGEEEKAQDLWFALWRRVDSIPRRRYVEDRLMTVAARLGTLAKIAVELEGRLLDGTADSRDAGLLVQIYTRVNDPVSATEIIEEYMKSAGRSEADVVAEKARIFMSCTDYFNYEQAIRRLIEIDGPENRPDHLRNLAMSILERGQREEARGILKRLKAEDGDNASAEFEAGVLAMSGLRKEALEAYRTSLARNPERVDTWLLVSNTLKDLGKHDLSAGMFQYLAATAEKDDLFTIAIDGVLNMRDGRQNRGAPDRLVKWARRCALERVAARPDKLYLHQLVADLSDEVNDTGMAIRALRAALPVAGEQRTPLLRELMDKTKGNRRGGGIIRIVTSSGMIIRQGSEQRQDDTRADHLMFGRRLLGQGDVVPPGVYLDLGAAFLSAGEVVNAARTYNAASRLPEFDELQRKIAASFEQAGYPTEALRVYERILTVETSDLEVMIKVAELHEQLGRDDLAVGLYRRGLDLHLSRKLLTAARKERDDTVRYVARNVDTTERLYPRFLSGLLATMPPEQVDAWLEAAEARLQDDLRRLGDVEQDKRKTLASCPRLEATARLLRRVASAHDRIPFAERMDLLVLKAFPADEELLEKLVRARLSGGFVVSARKLIASSDRPTAEKGRLNLLVGSGTVRDLPGSVAVAEAATMVLPLLVRGDEETVRAILNRLDLASPSKEDLPHLPLLVSTAGFVKESEPALSLLRHWVSVAMKEKKGNALYQPISQVLMNARRSLDKDQFTSLVEGVIQAIVDNPDRFSAIIRRLPSLQKDVGSDLLTGKQVKRLITAQLAATDGMVYGLGELFMLIPAEDRALSVRSMWNKLPKTGRAMVLTELMGRLEDPCEPSMASFIQASIPAALRDVEDKNELGWLSRDIAGDGSDSELKNPALVLAVCEALVKIDPDQVNHEVGSIAALHALGRDDEVRRRGLVLWEKLATSTTKDYLTTAAINRLVGILSEDNVDALLTTLDGLEKKQGKQPRITQRRLTIIATQKDEQRLHEAFLKAAADHPEDAAILARVNGHLSQRGLRLDSLRMRERQLELQPKNSGIRSSLESGWNAMRHPLRALSVRLAGRDKKQARPAGGTAGEKKEKTPAATVGGLKKAVEAGDDDLARRMFRRLWRVFPNRTGPMYGGFVLSAGAGFRNLIWPQDPKPKENKKPAARGRGGLPTTLDKKIEDRPATADAEDDETPPAKKPEKRRTVYEVLSETTFGDDEMRRLLRSLSGAGLDRAAPLLTAIAQAEVKARGVEATVTALLEKDRQGLAGKREYGLLFALLEQAKDAGGDQMTSTLESLMGNVNANDTGQLRRMARLYARAGDATKASVLWTWCASAGSRQARWGQIDQNLLNEVITELKGEQRDTVVTAILEAARPDDDVSFYLANYSDGVLRTWLRVGGPDTALARCEDVIKDAMDTSRVMQRTPCKAAAYLLARAGRLDEAIRCLKVAYCKLPLPEDGDIDPWFRDEWTTFGWGSYHDFRRLFPQDVDGWSDPGAWFARAATHIDQWTRDEIMEKGFAFEALAVLSIRLHEAGRKDEALKWFDRASELAGDESKRQLWLADTARRLGQEDRAGAIEHRLFKSGRLHPERIPQVIQRINDTQGAAAAAAVARETAEYCMHPALLRFLMMNRLQDGDFLRAAGWGSAVVLSGAAEAALSAKSRK